MSFLPRACVRVASEHAPSKSKPCRSLFDTLETS